MESANKKYILMIDDEENVLTLNEQILTFASDSILCFKARTLAEARDKLRDKQEEYDLFILDIMLPDGSGLDFIREIHSVSDAPILMLSAKNTPKDIIEGAARGGDNYITKPYDPEAMAALALAMLRREEKRGKSGSIPVKIISCGPLTLDLVANRAHMNGVDAGLHPKEFALLLTLVRRRGQIVPAKELYETAWNMPAIGDTRTLWPHISNLKKKLSLGYDNSISIETVYGSGYRLDYNKNFNS